MPDDRFFHKRAGHSEKVNQLTDLEELIWRYYVLSSDDFGVMRFTPAQIRADHERANRKPERVIQKALERIRDVALVYTFTHQGREYCYSRNWQRYQKVSYPRETINPSPPPAELERCEDSTRELFTWHPGGAEGRKRRASSGEDSRSSRGAFKEDSENVSEIVREDFPLTRARAKAEAKAMAKAQANGSGSVAVLDIADVPDAERERAARFVEQYADLFQQFRRGARYVSRPSLDFLEALQLVRVWDDERLVQLAEAFLTTDEPYCRNGSGTIAHFRSRASWCDSKLREAGL